MDNRTVRICNAGLHLSEQERNTRFKLHDIQHITKELHTTISKRTKIIGKVFNIVLGNQAITIFLQFKECHNPAVHLKICCCLTVLAMREDRLENDVIL